MSRFKHLPDPPTLYGLEDCGTSKSNSDSFKAIDKYWQSYCELKGRVPAFVSPQDIPDNEKFGLSLYNQDLFSDVSVTPQWESFDIQVVVDFFLHLSRQDKFTSTNMTKVISFFNCHLKAEYKVRMKNGNHPYPRLGQPAVGTIPEIKRIKSSLNKSLQKRDIHP